MADPAVIKKVLIDAADLLMAKGWCRWTAARDRSGHPVDAQSDSACRFCVEGALYRADEERWIEARNALADHVGVAHTARWNDTPGRRRKDVVAALRGAAASLEAK